MRRSLRYGVSDMLGDLVGRAAGRRERLRPDEFWAVRSLSFQAAAGECVGLIGPNGAGKSTVLKLLSGILRPDVGTIHIRGRVGALVELGAGFHPNLTGRENIFINGAILGMTRREIDRRFDEIVAFAGIEGALDSPVGFYSNGMRARLGFSVAAHLDCDILLIDELLAVGDAQFAGKCANRISQLKDDGTLILFVSHEMENVQRLCSRAIVLGRSGEFWDLPSADAAAQYNALMLADGTRTSSVVSMASDIRLERLEVLDDTGRPLPEPIPSGTPVELRVHYTCPPERLRGFSEACLTFELRFWGGAGGVLVATVSTQGRQEFDDLHERGVVSIRTRLPFAPGPYRVACGFRAPNGVGLIGWAYEIRQLSISGPGYTEGLVSLECEIEHLSDVGALPAATGRTLAKSR